MSHTYGYRTFMHFLKTSSGGINAAFTTGGTGTASSTGSTHGGTITAGPATGKVWYIQHMHVDLGSAAQIYSTKYGDGTALTIGASVFIRGATGNIVKYLLGSSGPFKNNHQWEQVSDSAEILGYTTQKKLLCRIAFPTAYNQASIVLDGDKSEKIAIWFKESTTGVVHHEYLIQGWEQDK